MPLLLRSQLGVWLGRGCSSHTQLWGALCSPGCPWEGVEYKVNHIQMEGHREPGAGEDRAWQGRGLGRAWDLEGLPRSRGWHPLEHVFYLRGWDPGKALEKDCRARGSPEAGRTTWRVWGLGSRAGSLQRGVTEAAGGLALPPSLPDPQALPPLSIPLYLPFPPLPSGGCLPPLTPWTDGGSLRGPGSESRRAGAGLLPMEWPEAKQMVPRPSSRPSFGERKSWGLCSNGVNLIPSISRFRSAGCEEGAHTSSDCPGDCISVCETPSPHSGPAHRKRRPPGPARSSGYSGKQFRPAGPSGSGFCAHPRRPGGRAFHYNRPQLMAVARHHVGRDPCAPRCPRGLRAGVLGREKGGWVRRVRLSAVAPRSGPSSAQLQEP